MNSLFSVLGHLGINEVQICNNKYPYSVWVVGLNPTRVICLWIFIFRKTN